MFYIHDNMYPKTDVANNKCLCVCVMPLCMCVYLAVGAHVAMWASALVGAITVLACATIKARA